MRPPPSARHDPPAPGDDQGIQRGSAPGQAFRAGQPRLWLGLRVFPNGSAFPVADTRCAVRRAEATHRGVTRDRSLLRVATSGKYGG